LHRLYRCNPEAAEVAEAEAEVAEAYRSTLPDFGLHKLDCCSPEAAEAEAEVAEAYRSTLPDFGLHKLDCCSPEAAEAEAEVAEVAEAAEAYRSTLLGSELHRLYPHNLLEAEAAEVEAEAYRSTLLGSELHRLDRCSPEAEVEAALVPEEYLRVYLRLATYGLLLLPIPRLLRQYLPG
jgi:hypothetical protein